MRVKQAAAESVLQSLTEPERKRSALHFIGHLGRGMTNEEIVSIQGYADMAGCSFYTAAKKVAAMHAVNTETAKQGSLL